MIKRKVKAKSVEVKTITSTGSSQNYLHMHIYISEFLISLRCRVSVAQSYGEVMEDFVHAVHFHFHLFKEEIPRKPRRNCSSSTRRNSATTCPTEIQERLKYSLARLE